MSDAGKLISTKSVFYWHNQLSKTALTDAVNDSIILSLYLFPHWLFTAYENYIPYLPLPSYSSIYVHT